MKIEGLIKRIKLPAKASAFYIGSSAAGKAVGVLTTPIFTRILSGEQYGEYARYMSIIGAVSLISSTITSSSALYNELGKSKDKKGDCLKSVLLINLVFSMAVCILLFAFRSFLRVNGAILLPMALQIFADGITAIYLTGCKFAYKYLRVSFILLGSALLPQVTSIILLKGIGGGYTVRIYSLLFVSLFIGVFALIKILKGGRINSVKTKEAIKYSLPLLPGGISSALFSQADKLILASIMGSIALAKYSVIFSLGMALQFTVSAIGSALSPWIMRRLKAGETDKIKRLFLPMLIGYIALSMCLIAVGPEAIKILAPPDYLDAFPALTPIALSVPFSFIAAVCTSTLVFYERSGYTSIVSLIGALLSVILNYTLIDFLGYFGAGLALLLCQAFITILEILALSRIGKSEIVCPKKLFPICVAGIVGCAILYLWRQQMLMRVIMLIIPASALLLCLYKAKELVIEKDSKTDS